MKDNDWIKYLREEEENFLPEAPDGLWGDIEGKLPSPKKSPLIVPLWLRCCGVAASVALLIGVGALLFTTPNNEVAHVKPTQSGVDNAKMMEQTNAEQASGYGFIDRIISVVSPSANANVACADTTASPQNIDEPAAPVPPSNEQKERGDRPNGNQHQRKDAHHDSWLAFNGGENKHGRAVAVSLFAGNIMASNASNGGGYLSSGMVQHNAQQGGTSYDDIYELNQALEVDTKTHYHQPLRAGVRVAIPISQALAIETGVSYTLLSSTTESGSTENYYRTEQKLHYIGVPVKLNWTLHDGKCIGVYASGGGMVEKCVSGKAKTKFIIGGNRNSIEENNVSEKPLQLSATLSAGVEAKVSKDISLFVEPGVSYYIDNHSSVDNIYKDKPLNFDINIGVRLNLNK